MPLLTAARENEWAAMFQPHILHAGEPPGGRRGVFVTGTMRRGDALDHDRASTRSADTWPISGRFPGARRSHRHPPGADGPVGSSRHGDLHVFGAGARTGTRGWRRSPRRRYREQMVEWETALNHYLRTGQRLGMLGLGVERAEPSQRYRYPNRHRPERIPNPAEAEPVRFRFGAGYGSARYGFGRYRVPVRGSVGSARLRPLYRALPCR